ncbi:MAG TPA: polysaccharide biosynthesis C-terminal domain-containing protein, partial [Saprospiraceae bacterium]|nr:polysaccharide biosynthesis C-terminal domain-containing protein [Saprospiraceae bacterium]
MGVIQRQSFKHSVVNFVGLGVGALSMVLLYPRVLEPYGLLSFMISVSTLVVPVLSLGANTVALRFFPVFEDKPSGHHGFLPLLLGMCLLGCGLGAVLAAVFWPQWKASVQAPLLREYLWAAPLYATLYIFNSVLAVYCANFKRIVVPSILFDLSQKFALPLLLLGVWQGWWPLPMALAGLMLHAALVLAGLVLYLHRLGEWQWWPDWHFLTPARRREVLEFVGVGAFGGFALLMVTKLDGLMVGSTSTLRDTGVYAIAVNIAAFIGVPTTSLYTASVSSVSRYLADRDLPKLDELYKKVSINLLVVGLLLLGALLISVDELFAILPNRGALEVGKTALLLLGLARLVEMATGLNNYLIYYSQYYRYSLLALGLLALGNVGFNLLLLPRMGLSGAALATLLSITLYNVFTLVMVWQKFGLQPFTRATPLALLLAVAAGALVWWVPRTGHAWADLV